MVLYIIDIYSLFVFGKFLTILSQITPLSSFKRNTATYAQCYPQDMWITLTHTE